MHRGRGRPPGSKRPKDVTPTDDSRVVSSVDASSAMHSSVQLKRHSSNSSGLESTKAPAKEVERKRAAGVDAALALLTKCGRAPFSSHDLFILEQVRQWGPLCDLERVRSVLEEQRDKLMERWVWQ